MSQKKFNFGGYVKGLKSLLALAPLVAVSLNIINSYAGNIMNMTRNLYGAQSLGLAPTIIGTAGSIYTLVMFVLRDTSARAADNMRKKIKWLTFAAFLCRGVWFLSLNVLTGMIGFYAYFVVDGIFTCFVQTFVMALMSLSIDRRVMGSGYSLMQALTTLIVSPSRQIGTELFRNYGIGRASMTAALLMGLGVLISLLIKPSKIEMQQEKRAPQAGEKKKTGIYWAILPLAICQSMCLVISSGEKNFFPIFGEQYLLNGVVPDYASFQTMGMSVSAVLQFVAGVLVDFVNPAYIIVFGLGCYAAAMFGMTAFVNNRSMMIASIVLYNAVTTMPRELFRVVAMRATPLDRQGGVGATFYFCNDGITMVSSAILGFVINAVGYIKVWAILGGVAIFAIALFIYTNNTQIKKLEQERQRMLDEAEKADAAA